MECVGARCVKCVIQFSDDPALRLFLPLSRTHRHAGQWRRFASAGNTREGKNGRRWAFNVEITGQNRILC